MPSKKRLYISVFNEISSLIKSGEFELVSVKANSGVYVLGNNLVNDDFSREISAFELLEARVLIEGEAAALAARMITPKELQELAAALSNLESEGVEDISSSGADRQFHSVIAEATHNRVIAKQIKDLWDIQENFNHIYEAHQSVCLADASTRIDDHTAIYNAIAAGNVSEARQTMRSHFSDLLEAMHDASEREAVEATKQKVSQLRERFTIGELESVSS